MLDDANRRTALRGLGLAAGLAALAGSSAHAAPAGLLMPGAVGTLPELQDAGFHYAR